MGARGWIIESNSERQQDSIRQWMLHVEDRKNVDWGLSFCIQIKRDDGSQWCLINSDGSGCIDFLIGDFGYRGDINLLDGEVEPWWDSPKSPLGTMDDATLSFYIDANESEFFPMDSAPLMAQEGKSVLIEPIGDRHERDFYRCICRMAETSRLIPDFEGDFWEVVNGNACYRGAGVSNLDDALIKQLESDGYAVIEVDENTPSDLRLGMVLPSDEPDHVSLWNRDGKFESYPIEK